MNRLLDTNAQNVLAGLQCPNGPGDVQVIGQRIVDGVDFRIGQQRFIAAIGFRNTKLFCGSVRGVGRTRRNRHDLAQIAMLHRRNDLFRDLRGVRPVFRVFRVYFWLHARLHFVAVRPLYRV